MISNSEEKPPLSSLSPLTGPFSAGSSSSSSNCVSSPVPSHHFKPRVPGSPVTLLPRTQFAVPSTPPHDAAFLHERLTRIKASFQLWDVDNDGFISKKDCVALLKEAGIAYDDASLSHLISLDDTDADGKVSWEEFRVAYDRKLRHDRLAPPEDLAIEMESAFLAAKRSKDQS